MTDSTEEGWYQGTLNGRTGLIPQNYVRIVPDAPTPASHNGNANVSYANSAAGSSSPTKSINNGWAWYASSHSPRGKQNAKSTLELSALGGSRQQGGSRTPRGTRTSSSPPPSAVGLSSPTRPMSARGERELVGSSAIPVGASPRTHHRMASAKSKQVSSGNYGEYLYQEGVKHKQWKDEQTELQLERKAQEEASKTPFRPEISKRSKQLVRDMPVVERLLLLDQV